MMKDGSYNNDSPRNPDWKPRMESTILNDTPSSGSDLYLKTTREKITSRAIQIEGRAMQALGIGIIGYSSVISADLKSVIAGALVFSAGRIALKNFK